jgi:hypothetical protein
MGPRDAHRDRARRAAAAILALALPACGGTDWTAAAEKSVAWTTKAEAQASLFALLYAVITVQPAGGATINATSADDYAVKAATDVVARLGACATTTTMGARDAYTFAHCSGARGLAAVDGKLDATYDSGDVTGTRIGVSFTGLGVDLGAGRLDLALAGGNAFPGIEWMMTPEKRAAFHLAETSPASTNAENRDALLDLVGDFGDHGCQDPAGHEQSPAGITSAHGFVSIDDQEAWTINVAAYHRCAGGCPAAGATIQIDLGEQVRVTFDGGATAHATNATTGDTAELPLACAP